VTLTRLFLAWVPVAVVFAAVGGLGAGLAKLSPTEAPDEWRKMALWRSLEAAAVTLFASLWFDSLGHGGWWLLFSLLGLTVALAQQPGPGTVIGGTPLARATRDVARFLVAGAILAWRLS